MLTALAVANYRSLRNLVVPLQQLNVLTGGNGSGKSSLYRALRLLADAAQGRLVSSLAREGGLPSCLWAGPESPSRAVQAQRHPLEGTVRKNPVSLRLGFAGDEFGYAIDLGLPAPSGSSFCLDPQIKRECIWHGPRLRPSALLVDRSGPVVRFRESGGNWNIAAKDLGAFESMMTHLSDPRNAPEMLLLRESIRAWRFYDHIRTDVDSPARAPQVGTRTPVLAHDGADLGAAIETIREVGDSEALDAAINDAFPGGSISVLNLQGRFVLRMQQPGLLRPLEAAELSDGTLRYILWVAALLTPRPPELMILNEPETSLHPELLPSLSRLIVRAAERSQLIVVTHSYKLLAALQEHPGCHALSLEKSFGETRIAGSEAMEIPQWQWPAR